MDINVVKHDIEALKSEVRRLPLSVVARKHKIEISELRRLLGLTAIDSTRKTTRPESASPRLKTVLEVKRFVERYNKKHNTDFVPVFK